MRRIAAVAIVLVLTLSGYSQTKRLITDKDLFRFQWIGDPQTSPDGSHVAFVRVTVNEKKDNYDTSLLDGFDHGFGRASSPDQRQT